MDREFVLTDAPAPPPAVESDSTGAGAERQVFMFRYKTLSLHLLDDFIETFFQSGELHDRDDQRAFDEQKRYFIEQSAYCNL